MVEVKEKPKLSVIENIFLSTVGIGFGNAVVKTSAAPIERIKLLLQNQGEMLKQGTISRPYTGIIDCTAQIYKNEGLFSFWRGNSVNCIRGFPAAVLTFLFKDKIKVMFKRNKTDSYLVSFAKNVASGGVAGALSLSFLYSLDYTYTRLANDVKNTAKGGERKYDGLVDVYKKTWATDGIAGLYRGFVISCAGIMIYRGCYFGLYDTFKPVVVGSDYSVQRAYLFGYAVTVTSGLMTYPLDTIRRRMMMRSGEADKYKGSLDCMLTIIRTEGVRSLFRGAAVNILRGIGGAGVLAGFDKAVQIYTSVKVDTSGGG